MFMVWILFSAYAELNNAGRRKEIPRGNLLGIDLIAKNTHGCQENKIG